jgi:hypothetical protein
MPKRAAPPSTLERTAASNPPPPKRVRKTATKIDDGNHPEASAVVRKRRPSLFPTDPTATRRVLAFDVGIVNLAYAVVTLTGVDDFAIESLAANNIMRDDPPGGPPTDDEVIAAAVAAGPPRRRRRGEPAPLPPPKAKGRGAKEPLNVLTERLTTYLWARVDRLLSRRPHAVVIEQQSKKALRLSALGAVIHSFVLNYYLAHGEEAPPVFMQSGRQKLRVVFRPLASSSPAAGSSGGGGGIAAWCAPSGAGIAPRIVTRFRVSSPVATTATTTTVTKVSRRAPKSASGKGGGNNNNDDVKGTAKTTKQETKTKTRTKTQQRNAEQKATWRANKNHAVANFAPILAHYPGCRRWKPLFDQCKKNDDLADAALHAIFLLKAGGTRLARTKDLDDALLIVLPARPNDKNNNGDDDDGKGGTDQKVAERKRPQCRRAIAAPLVPAHADRRIDAHLQQDQNGGGDVGDDGIIDLVHYATDDAAYSTPDDGATDDNDDLSDSSDLDDDGSDDDDDDDSIYDDDDSVQEEEGDDSKIVRPTSRRSHKSPLYTTTTTRPTTVSFSDSDLEEEEEEEDEDGDDTWAVDLGICPSTSPRRG